MENKEYENGRAFMGFKSNVFDLICVLCGKKYKLRMPIGNALIDARLRGANKKDRIRHYRTAHPDFEPVGWEGDGVYKFKGEDLKNEK